MSQRYENPLLGYFGNVDDPQLSTDAANKRYVDSRVGGSVYWDVIGTTNIASLAVAGLLNTPSLSFAGNVASSFPNNGTFKFANDGTVYTAVGGGSYSPGLNITLVTISPVLAVAQTVGATVVAVTRTQVTDFSATGNVSGSVSGSGVTLDAFTTGQSSINVFSGVDNFQTLWTWSLGTTGAITAGINSQLQLSSNTTVANLSFSTVNANAGVDLSAALVSAFAQWDPAGLFLIDSSQYTNGTITITYSRSNQILGNPSGNITLTLSGDWTNLPPTPAISSFTQNGATTRPTFKPLSSLQVQQAVFGTPSNRQVVAWDSANARLAWQTQTGGITSINTQTGPAINVTAGTGIGISTAGNTITVTNTGSGSIASGNFTSFNAVVQRSGQSTQAFPPTAFITSSALDQAGIYVDITGGGWLNETQTLLDGGAIGNTTYITTATRTGTNGLIFPVSTTYGEVECQLFTQNLTLNVTYNSAGGTLGSVRVEAYFALRGLNASSSQAPYQSSAVFPPFSFPSDGVTFLYVFQPVYTFANTGTGSATLTIPAAQFRAISPQYTGLGTTNEYIPYLRVLLFNTASNPAPLLPTSASVTAYSALPSMRVLMTLPGVGGATPTIQQVLNTGNTATNTTGNISNIILNDSVSGSSTTLDGTQVRSRLHQFDGSTSGNVQVRAAATTTSYALTLPAAQATAANQTLINNGSGVLSWGTGGGATNVLPYDTITWTNSGSLYASDKTVAIQTVNGTLDPTLSFITLASTLSGFTQGAAVIGTTSTGASVSGFYQVIATIPSIQTINVDRASGLVAGTAYSFQWRQGKLGTAGNYIDTMPGAAGIGTSVFFNELGYSGNGVTVTADAVNVGRYLLNITPTLNNILGNDNRTSGRNFIISQADQLRFQDTTQPTPNYVSLKAAASALTANVNLTLPTALPTTTLPLVSDSTGNLSFATGLALTTGSVTNAPVNGTDIARLSDVQAAAQGIRPVAPAGQTVHVSSSNIVGTYANNAGIGSATFTTTSQLIINAVTPAVGDWVLLAGQTPSSPGNIANGSYTVTSNAAGGAILTRTNVTPAFGNLYVVTATGATNFGEQWENVTTGTITIGTTPLVFLLFGARNPTSALIYKQTVRLASVPAQPLTAIPSSLVIIDGITPVAGDRILLKDFSTPLSSTYGGIYIASNTGTWQLAADWQQNVASTLTNAVIIVTNGSINSGNSWIQTNTIVTVGTSPTAWQLFSASGSPTLQSVLFTGRTATATASSGLTLFSDLGTPLVFQNASGIPQLVWNTTSAPAIIGANIQGDLLLNPFRRLNVYSTNGSVTNALTLTESNISRNGTGNLSVLAGTNSGDAVILGTNNTNTPNNIAIFSATAGSGATLTAQGTDTNIPLVLTGKGNSGITIGSNLVNYWMLSGSSATNPVALNAVGSDANIGMNINGKGNGSLTLSNVNCGLQIASNVNTSVTLSPNTSQQTLTQAQLRLAGLGSSPSASNILVGTNFANYWSFAGAATPGTGNPTILCQPAGLSTTTNIQLSGLGAGNVILSNPTQCAVQVLGNQLTQSVLQAVSTTVTNCSLLISPQGTGNITLGDVTGTNAQLLIQTGSTTQLIEGISGGATNVDRVISAKGTGTLIALNGLALNSGSTATPAYSAPLLAANAAGTPTAMTAGSIGSQLLSRGSGASPYWWRPGNYESTYTSTTVIPASTNFIVIFPTAGTNLNALSYNNTTGLFTAQRACYVLFSFDAIYTSINTATVTEGDIWLSKNGTVTSGTRYGQVAFNLGAGATQGSQILSLNQPISLNAGDTIYCYSWCSGSWILGGQAFGGAQTRLVVIELAQF